MNRLTLAWKILWCDSYILFLFKEDKMTANGAGIDDRRLANIAAFCGEDIAQHQLLTNAQEITDAP